MPSAIGGESGILIVVSVIGAIVYSTEYNTFFLQL